MKITTAIIAGGKSSRMGTDKANVVFGDSTLLEHAIATLLPFSHKLYISSNKEYKGIDYPIVKDGIKNIGPIGGIYSILKNCDAEKVLVIPIDTPLISKDLLTYIIRKHDKNNDATLCKTKDGLQMLVGIYSKTILPILEKQIENQDYKLSNLLAIANIQILDMEKYADKFTNINTLNDLRQVSKNQLNEG